MLRFFKYSGILQLIVLLVGLIILRLPLLITNPPLFTEDLKHFVTGERMSNGFLMYRDIIDSTPPIPSYFYMLLTDLFGRSSNAFYIVAMLLIFVQGISFRELCNRNNLLSESGDVPVLVYLICASICFDFYSLSPALLSLTFIIPTFAQIFSHLRDGGNDAKVFLVGFYLGLAYLCFPPCLLFLLLAILIFLTSSRTNLRLFLLLIIAFVFPSLCLVTFFYLNDGLEQFCRYFLFAFPYGFSIMTHLNYHNFWFVVVPSIVFCLLGASMALTYKRFIIYQVISQRVMFLSLLVVAIAIQWILKSITSSYILLLPFIAFFVTHFFLLFKRKGFGNFLCFSFLVYSLVISYSYFPWIKADIINFNGQVCLPNKWNSVFENQKVCMLGNDSRVFINNKLAGPYFDWNLSKETLSQPNTYGNVVKIYDDFRTDMPDVIMDEYNVMPMIFERIPFLRNQYKETKYAKVYIKRQSSLFK